MEYNAPEIKKQKYHWGFSDKIKGCAVDNKYDSKHHQLASIEELPNAQYRLNYMICCPERDFSLKEIIPGAFIDLIHSNDPRKRKEARHQFSDISRMITDDQNQELFIEDDYKKALNFTFDFDPTAGYKITSNSIRICHAQMDSVVTYKQANTKILDKDYKPQLELWNKFISHYKFGHCRNGVFLPYEDVVNLTTKLVQETATKEALAQNIQCVMRRKVPSNNRNDQYCYIGSERSTETKASGYHWTTPITTSKILVPAVNAMTFKHFKENNGKNLISPEVVDAFAHMAPYANTRPRKQLYI